MVKTNFHIRYHIDKDFLPKYHGSKQKLVIAFHPTQPRVAIHVAPPSFEHSEIQAMISKSHGIPAQLENNATLEGFVCQNGSKASSEPHVGLRIHVSEGKLLEMTDRLTPEQWITALEAIKKAGHGNLPAYMFYGDGMDDAKIVGKINDLLAQDKNLVQRKIASASQDVLNHLKEQAAQVEEWHKKHLKLKEVVKLETPFTLTSEDKKSIGFTDVPYNLRQSLEQVINEQAEKLRLNLDHKHAAEKRRDRNFLLKEAITKAMGNFHNSLDPTQEQGLRQTLAEIKSKKLPLKLEIEAVPEIEKTLELIFEIRRQARLAGINPDSVYHDIAHNAEFGKNHAERVENHFKLWKVFVRMLGHVEKINDLTA